MANTGRTETGTFAAGHKPLPGAGRPRYSVSDAIKRGIDNGTFDPERIAVFLYKVITDDSIGSRYNTRDKLHAAELWMDRTEGKAVTTANIAAVVAQVAPQLPPGFARLSPEDRRAWLAVHVPAALAPSSGK